MYIRIYTYECNRYIVYICIYICIKRERESARARESELELELWVLGGVAVLVVE
jgi:hypothetical protein